jgi:peptide/nickel transport system permease protein
VKKYLLKRVLLLIPVLLGVSLIVFFVMRVFTADPAAAILGQHATDKQIAELRESLGFNDPLIVQYWNYLKNLIRGDLGSSLYSQTKVADELFARFPATIELAISAVIFASVFGVGAGVISAVKKNSIFDYIGMSAALIGVSIPIFWLGVMLILLFSVILGWLPVSGRIDMLMSPPEITGFYLIDTFSTGNFEMFKDAFRHLILPSVTLGMYSTAVIARMTRSAVLETLEQDYVRTARAKGLKEKTVIVIHALRNAALPIVTVIGLQLGSLLGGAVLTETVFAWPGIGKYTVDAITRSDYPVVQGAVLLVAFIFVIVNLFVDLIYAALDPRIKYS